MDVEEFAIRTHLWHLTVPVEADPDDPPRRAELYRKPEDRWDQNDVAEEYPEVAEHLEPVALRRMEPGRHQSLDLFEDATIVSMGFDRRDIHIRNLK